jgi:hypothetical protein
VAFFISGNGWILSPYKEVEKGQIYLSIGKETARKLAKALNCDYRVFL